MSPASIANILPLTGVLHPSLISALVLRPILCKDSLISNVTSFRSLLLIQPTHRGTSAHFRDASFVIIINSHWCLFSTFPLLIRVSISQCNFHSLFFTCTLTNLNKKRFFFACKNTKYGIIWTI